MSRRTHKSSSKVNTSSSIEAQSSRQDQPWPPRSFLFSVNQLPINDDPDEGGEVPLANEYGRWTPPVYRNGFKEQITGHLYRWQEGTISRAQDCPWSIGAFRMSATNNNPLILYKNQTMFWCNSFDQFMTVPGDATEYSVANHAPIGSRWWPLSFYHDESVSRVQVSGIENHLASHGLRWIPSLGLESYTNDETPQHGGLSGDLAILIGLIAFSCRSRDLANVLLVDQAWRDYRWRPHPRSHGRREQTGVIVNVYRDPANQQGSTESILSALEWSGPALLR